MTYDGCYDLDELLGAEDVAGDDPRHTHLAACARCRSALASYHRFFDPGVLPASADLADARERLSAFRAARIAPGVVVKPRLRRWRTTAMSLAAVLAVVVGISQLIPDHGAPRRKLVLRDPGEGEALVVAAATVLPGGGVRWSWQPVEGADSYEVVLFDRDLAPVRRLAAGDTLALELPADAWRAECDIGVWQVVARRGGDEIARSRPRHLSGS